MIDGATETQTPVALHQVKEGNQKPDSFSLMSDNNNNGVDMADSSGAAPANSAELDDMAFKNQMEAMAKMQEARANIASVQAAAEAQGGENMAGFIPQNETPDDTHTIMNAAEPTSEADMQSLVEKAQAGLLAGTQGEAPTSKTLREQMQDSKKKHWNWSTQDIKDFMNNFASQLKLNKAAGVVKSIFQIPGKAMAWFGRWFTDAPKIQTPQSQGLKV